MGIPLVALRSRAPELATIESPLVQNERLLRLQGLAQNQQLQQQDIEAGERQKREGQIVMQALGRHGGNIGKALPELRGQIGWETYTGLEKADAEKRRVKAQATAEELELENAQSTQLLGIIDWAEKLSDDQYMQAWPSIVTRARLIKPDIQLGDQPPPKDRLNAARAALMVEGYYAKAAKEARDKATHGAELPGKQAKSAQDVTAFAAQTMRGVKSGAQWGLRRSFAISKFPELAQVIPERYSPEAVEEMRQMAGGSPQAPTTRVMGNRTRQWNPQTQTWEDVGAGPGSARSSLQERYDLYQSDPEAYRGMFGEPGARQDQAQAARMLQYFARRRQQVISDWSLGEEEREQELAELEELEQPYLDAAMNPAGPRGQGPAQFQPGQTVYDQQGNPRRIKRVLPDGRLELE